MTRTQRIPHDTLFKMEEAARCVEAASGLSLDVMRGQRQTREVSGWRAILCWMIDRYTGVPTTRIGDFLGKDHSTVYAAIQRVDSDPRRLAAATDTLAALRGGNWQAEAERKATARERVDAWLSTLSGAGRNGLSQNDIDTLIEMVAQ